MSQQQYWNEFYISKVQLNYFELYLQESEFYDKTFTIILAIASSVLVPILVYKKNDPVYAVILGGLIVILQTVGIICKFLPYKARLKAMPGLVRELEDLLLVAEIKWFNVANGELTIEEINKLTAELMTKKLKAQHNHLKGIILPEKVKTLEKARQKADTYFNGKYPIKEE